MSLDPVILSDLVLRTDELNLNLANINASLSQKVNNVNLKVSEVGGESVALTNSVNQSLSTEVTRAESTLESGIEDIDTELIAIINLLNGISSDVTEATSKIETIGAGSGDTEEGITILVGKVNTLTTNLNNTKALVEDIEGKSDTLVQKTTSIESKVNTSLGKIDSILSKVTSNNDVIAIVGTKCGSGLTKLSEVKPDINVVVGKVNQIDTNVGVVNSKINAVKSNNITSINALSSLNTLLTSIKALSTANVAGMESAKTIRGPLGDNAALTNAYLNSMGISHGYMTSSLANVESDIEEVRVNVNHAIGDVKYINSTDTVVSNSLTTWLRSGYAILPDGDGNLPYTGAIRHFIDDPDVLGSETWPFRGYSNATKDGLLYIYEINANDVRYIVYDPFVNNFIVDKTVVIDPVDDLGISVSYTLPKLFFNGTDLEVSFQGNIHSVDKGTGEITRIPGKKLPDPASKVGYHPDGILISKQGIALWTLYDSTLSSIIPFPDGSNISRELVAVSGYIRPFGAGLVDGNGVRYDLNLRPYPGSASVREGDDRYQWVVGDTIIFEHETNDLHAMRLGVGLPRERKLSNLTQYIRVG